MGAHRAYPRGHMAAFAVDPALVASQWQHRIWTVHLHPYISTKHEVAQDTSTIFLVFSMTWPSVEPSLPALVAHAQPNFTT